MVALADGTLQESLVRGRQFDLEAQVPSAPPSRQYHLDWLRSILVLFVVYAHIAMMGLEGTVKLDGNGIQIDDHAWVPDHPSNLSVRWISLVRPVCLPMLFWVSGAAVSFSYRGTPPGLLKLAIITIIGMACNAALWELGPKDPHCGPQNPCHDHGGIMFDFTVVPKVDRWFAVLFQMWYTVVLMVFLVVNWPLFALVTRASGKNRPMRLLLLGVQWCFSMALYTIFLAQEQKLRLGKTNMGSFDWRLESSVLKPLAIYEAIYLALSPMVASAQERTWKVPTRLFHYLAAGVAMQQFACIPFAQRVDSISVAFVLYIVVGFNKFFTLGFLMTKAKQATPLTYNVWPIMLVVMPLVAPSSNFYLAGNLTFPFFPREQDRVFYVAFALTIVFMADRIGRETKCKPLPSIFVWCSLVLYLVHPVLISCLLKEGIRDGMHIWMASAGLALCLTQALLLFSGLCGGLYNASRRKSVDNFPKSASVPPSWRPYNVGVTV